jgi:hypothetical protein
MSRRFSDAMGAGLCVVQVGDQQLCPDGAAPGLQVRHSRGLDLALTRHHRTAQGLAGRAAAASRESGSLPEASEVANVVTFMLTRPRRMTIRDVIMMPTNFDLSCGEFEVPISLCTALPGHIGRLSDSK